MQAVVFDEYGPPEVLHVAEVPEPHAGPGQVRVRVQAAGVNVYDTKVRRGLMAKGRPLSAPGRTGLEAAGVVDEVGEGVAGVAAGDAVFGFTVGGAAAEYAVLDVWAPQPRTLSAAQAAGLPVAAEVSIRVLRELGVGPGQTLLVHGGAGGVGQTAIQIARHLGARVIATASERNHELLDLLGATPTTYGDGLTDRVRELAPAGVDAVFDAAGTQLDDLLAIAGGPRRIVTIANFDAGSRGVRVSTGPRAAGALAEAALLAERGALSVRVVRTFGLTEAAGAHALSESRSAAGKIVLVVG